MNPSELRQLTIPQDEEVLRLSVLLTTYIRGKTGFEEQVTKRIASYNRRKIKKENHKAFAIDFEAIQNDLAYDILNRMVVVFREEAERKGKKIDPEKFHSLTRKQIKELGDKDPLVWKIRHMLLPKYIGVMVQIYYNIKAENQNLKPCEDFDNSDDVRTICLEKVNQNFISYRYLMKHKKQIVTYTNEYRKTDGVWTYTGIKLDTSQLDDKFFLFLGMWK